MSQAEYKEEKETIEDIEDEMSDHHKFFVVEATDFEDMGLRFEILRGMFSAGFEKPTVIQQKGIVIFTHKDRPDLITQAQSGTGKTATFLISLMQNLDESEESINTLQGLILSPTSELADCILRRFVPLAEFTTYKIHCSVGGTPVRFDQEKIKDVQPNIIIGTPDRVKLLIEDGSMNVDNIKMLILDETDFILNRGFEHQLYSIFQYLPKGIQIGLNSSTMTPGVKNIAEKFCNKPFKILLKETQLSLKGITQFYIDVGDDRNKYTTLLDLYKKLTINKILIFCNSKKKVDELAEKMIRDDFSVGRIYDGMKKKREEVMNDFKVGETRVLIACGLIKKGLHKVSLVINYDIPSLPKRDEYLHRIGRSGMFCRKGLAINFVTRRDMYALKCLEKFFQTQIDPCPNDVNKFV